jgi:hypothetical protein
MPHQSAHTTVANDELEALAARLGLVKPSYSRLETAAILGISESGVDRLLKSEKLPSFAVGERIIVARRDLLAFMYERQRGSPPPSLPKPEPKAKQPRRRGGRPRKARVGRKRGRKHG